MTKKIRRFHGVAMFGLLLLSLGRPVMASTEDEGGKGLAFLVPAIVQAASSAIGMGMQTLFSNLFNWAARPINCALGAEGGMAGYGMGYGMQPISGNNCKKDETQGSGTPGAVQDSASFNQPAPTLGRMELERLSERPVVALVVQKYAGKDASAPPLETIRFDRVGGGIDTLRFDIRTGEHFALRFDTSVPGRVRLVNTDSGGKTETVGFYEVVGSSENRMPRRTNIEMVGVPGSETLEVIFTPCISAALVDDGRVAQFRPYLPACGDEAATKSLPQVAMQHLDIGKGMSNPEFSANTSTVLMAAPASMSKGASLNVRILINHLPPAVSTSTVGQVQGAF